MSDDPLAFLKACVDEDERVAKDRLCIHCGWHTVPLRSALGITGYTHDGRMSNGRWEYGWQGKRCQNRITGAEPVQNPARALREVAFKRAILAMCEIDDSTEQAVEDGDASVAEYAAERTMAGLILQRLLAVYSDRPGFKPEWVP